MKIHLGVVESRSDPLKLGRCRVRIMGIMTDNKSELPTEDLPWAVPIQPITSAAISGIGHSPVGPVEGTWVTIIFLDGDDSMQYPAMTGTIAGIPGLTTNISDIESFDQDEEPVIVEQNYVTTGSGGIVTTTDGTPVQSGSVDASTKVLGNMNQQQLTALKKVIADAESSGGKNLDNGKGFIGKYQLGLEVLEDQGYIVKGSSKLAKAELGNANFNKKLYDSSVWTGKNGITSSDVFKSNSLTQEKTMDTLLQTNLKRLSGAILTNTTPPEKQAGVLATAHLVGHGKARQVINTGLPKVDGNGTSTNKYYDMGYKAVSGKSTAEAPTTANIDKPAIDKNEPEQAGNKKYDVPSKNANKGTAPKQGFVDPNGVYPRKSQLNEPDTSRLARSSKLKQTIVGAKENSLTTSIPVANGGSWSQPPIPYAATYPFNHVYESESGHVLEFDDTPNNERVNIHHKAGTFIEIDSYGNQVNKIVGSGITIIEKDGLVYIQGSGHITAMGDFSIKAGGSCQIQVTGNANINVGGSVFQTVGGDYNIKAGGNFNVDAAQIMLNSGAAQGAQSYSPSIQTITAPTRQEVNDVITEDTPKPIPKETPPETIKEEDKTPPLAVIPTVTECGFSELTPSTQISTNYNLQTLCTDFRGKVEKFPFKGSQTGGKVGLQTDLQIACNLKHLCINVIEPIRAKYGHLGMQITSCFRAGSKSQHTVGQAVDIQFTSFNKNRKKYYEFAKELKDAVPFDQFLLEYRAPSSVWFHISFNSVKNRGEIMTLNNDSTEGLKGQGLVLIA